MSFTIARAPLRISLFGGGSDRPEYYEKYGTGQVLSFTIDKYMHVVLNKVDNQALKLMYNKIETVNNINDLQHDIVREVWKHWNLGMGWEIASFADLPTVGTGLGSSSSFAVALVEALSNYTYFGDSLEDKADIACMIEMDLCKSPIGKQDQYATALGGLNHIFFDNKRTRVINLNGIDGINIGQSDLQKYMMLFYTGISRSTNEVLSRQPIDTNTALTLKYMTEIVPDAVNAIFFDNFKHLGELLDRSWNFKRSLPGASNDTIDQIYSTAKSAGAWGGKILGAGGGGFMLFMAHPDYHQRIREALGSLKQTPFSITPLGVQTLYNKD